MATTSALISIVNFHDYAELRRNNDSNDNSTVGFIVVHDPSIESNPMHIKVLSPIKINAVVNSMNYKCVPFVKNATSPLAAGDLHTARGMCTSTVPLHYDESTSRFITADVDERFPMPKDAHFLFIDSASLPQSAHPTLCIHSASNAVYLTDRRHSLIIDTFNKRGVRNLYGVTRFCVIDALPITLDLLRTANDEPALFALYSHKQPDKITALYTNAPYLERRRAEIELAEEEALGGHENSQKRQKTTALDRLTKKCEKLQKRTKLVDEVDIAKMHVASVLHLQKLPTEESIRNSRMLLARNVFLQFKENSKIDNMRDAHSAMSAALAGYDV